MICLQTFEIKSKENFDNWKQWCIFVNENYQYGIKESTVWDWKNKCKDSELPSYHPYWTMRVWEERKMEYERISEKYMECIEDPDKIKYYFRADMSLKDVENKVMKIKNNVEILEKRIRY